VVQPRAFERVLADRALAKQRGETFECRVDDRGLSRTCEALRLGAGGPRDQQRRAHGQGSPERRERRLARVKERDVAIAAAFELFPEGMPEAQQDLDYRAGRKMS